MYLCLCKGVTEAQVRQLARSGTTTAPALISALGLKEKRLCGRCIRDIAEFVKLATLEAIDPIAESERQGPGSNRH